MSVLHVVNISLVSVLLTAECFTCTDLSPVFSLSRPHPNTCILLFTEQALYYMADEKGSRSSVWIQSPNWKKWISVLILILFDLIKRLRNVWIYILTWLILSIYNLAKTVEIYRDIYWFDYVYVLKCPRKLEYILICILTWPNNYFDLSKGAEIYLDLYLDLLSICLDLSKGVKIYFDIFCIYTSWLIWIYVLNGQRDLNIFWFTSWLD